MLSLFAKVEIGRGKSANVSSSTQLNVVNFGATSTSAMVPAY